jgi:regulator of PEP synthase PpsR (kinase-PPPase family)
MLSTSGRVMPGLWVTNPPPIGMLKTGHSLALDLFPRSKSMLDSHLPPVHVKDHGRCPHGDDVETLTRLFDCGLALGPGAWPPPQELTGCPSHSMPQRAGSYFHLHLVSDATGETLTTVARAATAQYTKVLPVEHVYPLVRTQKQLDRVLAEIEESPGIVLYTLLDDELLRRLEEHCRELSLPCLSIMGPVLQLLQSYLGTETSHRVGAQHTLNAEYFKRIDALNYTMLHDDGQHLEGLEEADVVLVGVSRTSKTPTSIYLANRGVKTGNVPVVPGVEVPRYVEALSRPLVVGLYASPERIVQIRQNRLLGLKVHHDDDQYIDRKAVAEEVAFSRKLCARHNWPSIDVTRRSIEETAATVLSLLAERRRHPVA